MEKQVDEKGGDLSVEERCKVHFAEDRESKHHNSADTGEDSEVKEKLTPCELHDDGVTHTDSLSHDKDAGGPCQHTDTYVKLAHGIEDAVMMHEPGETSATHGKDEHISEDASFSHEPAVHSPKTPCNGDAVITEGKISLVKEVATVSNERVEKLATHGDEHLDLPHGSERGHKTIGKAPHGDEGVSLSQESGERHKTQEMFSADIQDAESLVETAERPTTHEKHPHGDTRVDLSTTSKENLTCVRGDEARHASHAAENHALSDVQEKNIDHINGEKSSRNGKHVYDGDDAGVSHDHENIHERDIVQSGTPHDHAENSRGVDDECDSKKEFSHETSREQVQFSRGSSPDVDTPAQGTSSPFSNTKSCKAGPKGVGVAEKDPGSMDGNLETPSTNWAFSVRASVAPSKFDHMATLRMTYGAYKENNKGREGVPLSLLPEILESARFMVPPPRDLVPLLQRIDIDYKAGDLVRWSLLQNLALQIERKEARYPSVFIPRPSVGRPSSNSPNSWKAQQRTPTRRTHPEDDCPELEPQVNHP